jgi:hypothetical protein
MEGIRMASMENLFVPGAKANRARIEKLGVEFIQGDLRSASDIDFSKIAWRIRQRTRTMQSTEPACYRSAIRVYSIPALAAKFPRVQDHTFALRPAESFHRGIR